LPAAAREGRNLLARALQEYGRLIKTNFIPAWRADEQLERRVTRQLNKGGALHALRRYLFLAREGQPRHRHLDEHGDQALCLTLVVNAVWPGTPSTPRPPSTSSPPRATSSPTPPSPTSGRARASPGALRACAGGGPAPAC
jgi:hypothetical protein